MLGASVGWRGFLGAECFQFFFIAKNISTSNILRKLPEEHFSVEMEIRQLVFRVKVLPLAVSFRNTLFQTRWHTVYIKVVTK